MNHTKASFSTTQVSTFFSFSFLESNVWAVFGIQVESAETNQLKRIAFANEAKEPMLRAITEECEILMHQSSALFQETPRSPIFLKMWMGIQPYPKTAGKMIGTQLVAKSY
jgi:hypothetical protein